MAAEHAVDEFVFPLAQNSIETLLDSSQLVGARSLVFANFLGRIADKTTANLHLPFLTDDVLAGIDQPNPTGNISFVFRAYTDALNGVARHQLEEGGVEPAYDEAAEFTADVISLESLRRVTIHRSILEQNGQLSHALDELLAQPLHDPDHTIRDLTNNGAHIDKGDAQPFSGLFKRATFVTRIQLNLEEKAVSDTLAHREKATEITEAPKVPKRHWWNRTGS